MTGQANGIGVTIGQQAIHRRTEQFGQGIMDRQARRLLEKGGEGHGGMRSAM